MATTNTKIIDLIPSGVEKRIANTVKVILEADTALVQAGVAARNPIVEEVASGGPRRASIPYLLPLATDVVNVSTDDMSQYGEVGKLSGAEFVVARHDLNMGWGYADLTTLVTGLDTKAAIGSAIGAYWQRVATKYATSSLKGAFAAVPSLTVGAVGTAFSLGLVIEAKVTGGIYANQFDTIIVSPKTKGKIDKMQEVSVIPNQYTNLGYDQWAGFKVIVSNEFGDNQSVLMRGSALAFGVSDAQKVPLEIFRSPNSGNGGGGEILHSRYSLVMHPQGFNYVGTAVPNYATLENAANWNKPTGVDDTMVGFRLIKHAA